MSSNSNRATGGLMMLLGVVAFFVAYAWPANSEHRGAFWGAAAGLVGFGIVLGQIGMMQDILGGIEDLKSRLQAVLSKTEELHKEVATLEGQPLGPDR